MDDLYKCDKVDDLKTDAKDAVATDDVVAAAELVVEVKSNTDIAASGKDVAVTADDTVVANDAIVVNAVMLDMPTINSQRNLMMDWWPMDAPEKECGPTILSNSTFRWSSR